LIFPRFQFCPEHFGFDRVVGIVGTEAGGFVVFIFVRVTLLSGLETQ